ncbi:MAG: asparagine synthase (glutamine-hydrolyzing), partial [Blastocatellia bacterium]|nr:asparagine synthase (glutamine-hydrolyzing) [Blastocatellia bacterium]
LGGPGGQVNMCGICGVARREPGNDGDAVARMLSSLVHRGPDGEGAFAAPHVHLGMRRLSIIDLAGAAQPLYNEDGTLALVANGEIYNYVELRAQLQARGHRFATHGDCETILHLYEEHGPDCVKHLRGMFAFALWDGRRRRLLLARDRMGEKPLYLYERPGELVFASELKALFGAGLVARELDPAAIDLYFHYHYVPEPHTPIRGVRKLPAGRLLLVDVDPWRIEERVWWRMEDAPPIEDDPPARIRAELETVSELIVRADVPVGVALSGGLDSSAITALAARRYPGTMNAFSVGYAEAARGDERAEARALADHLGIPFHEVALRTEELVRAFPRLVHWQDDPIADISGFGYYAVMKLAREHGVPVMLQGHGGDELFWGYPWARRAVRETRHKAEMQRAGGGSLRDYLQLEAPESPTRMGLFRWARSLAGLRSSAERFRRDRAAPRDQLVFYDLVPDFALAARETAALYADSFLERLNGAGGPTALFTIPQPWPAAALLLTRLQCDTYLRENGVAQGDRLSMASSVELRLPLLDYRLVEVVVGLRKVHDDSQLPPKAWLRAAVADLLPDWVLNRPKRGFTPPVRKWYRALFAAYGELLIDGALVQAGVLAPRAARELARGAHPLGVTAPLSFKALVLEMWWRNLKA